MGSASRHDGVEITPEVTIPDSVSQPGSATRDAARCRVGVAWICLCGALALHVADEALTGFLSVYNPAVRQIRAVLPWAPLPVFDFDVWIVGLGVAIAALLSLSPVVFRGGRGVRALGYALSVFMTLNGLGHFAGSIALGRAMPGVYSSPILLAAAVFLFVALRRSAHRVIPTA